MNCNICDVNLSKYKCPSCRIPYCSIPCWKTHQSGGCQKELNTSVQVEPDANSNERKPTYNFPTEHTVPPEKLKLLDDNEQLKAILCNPHVRAILSSLDEAANPSKLLHDAMQEPIFVEFVDECMRTIDPPSPTELDEAIMQSSNL